MIRTRVRSAAHPGATTRSVVAVASPERISSAITSTVKPCASRIFGAAVAARRKQFERAALLDICAADHEAILMTTFGTAS